MSWNVVWSNAKNLVSGPGGWVSAPKLTAGDYSVPQTHLWPSSGSHNGKPYKLPLFGPELAFCLDRQRRTNRFQRNGINLPGPGSWSRSIVGVRRTKVKVTWGRSYVWKPLHTSQGPWLKAEWVLQMSRVGTDRMSNWLSARPLPKA